MSTQFVVNRLKRSGGRNSRHEALFRARSGPFLCLCLGFESHPDATDRFVLEFAVAASKKAVSKSAVVRNKARRRIRSALIQQDFQQEVAVFKNSGATHIKILVVTNREALELPFDVLKTALKQGLVKLFVAIRRKQGEKNVQQS
ncbi:hypothetical protein EBU99_01765 [bacterium]|nr:hypothetical protein [bacterium]